MKYNNGDRVKVRRLKDLKCQYYLLNHGFEEGAGMSNDIIRSCCGKTFTIKQTGSFTYILFRKELYPMNWWFSECYLEDAEGCETQ